jgi:hypothetical protein
MTKIAAIWYMTPGRSGRHQVVEVHNTEDIKPTFGRLLFENHANNLLVNYDNSLYVIEPCDREASTYLRRKIEYHPLSHLVAS